MASFGGIETESQSAWFKMRYEDYSPMSKMVQSQEAIELIIWLIKDSPESLNGENIMLDGGYRHV